MKHTATLNDREYTSDWPIILVDQAGEVVKAPNERGALRDGFWRLENAYRAVSKLGKLDDIKAYYADSRGKWRKVKWPSKLYRYVGGKGNYSQQVYVGVH